MRHYGRILRQSSAATRCERPEIIRRIRLKDLETGEVMSTGLPASNVLYYDLTDDAWLCVRPSGTEPKVKFYYGIKGTSLEDADEKSKSLGEKVVAMIDSML